MTAIGTIHRQAKQVFRKSVARVKGEICLYFVMGKAD
jgi:hypothetical protein